MSVIPALWDTTPKNSSKSSVSIVPVISEVKLTSNTKNGLPLNQGIPKPKIRPWGHRMFHTFYRLLSLMPLLSAVQVQFQHLQQCDGRPPLNPLCFHRQIHKPVPCKRFSIWSKNYPCTDAAFPSPSILSSILISVS